MKAEIHGIKVEGTPQDIADLIELVSAAKEQTVTYVKFVPHPETPSPYPCPQSWWTDPSWKREWTCSTTENPYAQTLTARLVFMKGDLNHA